MRRVAAWAAAVGLAVSSIPANAGAGTSPETAPAAGALTITVQVEAETLLEVAPDGSIVRVRSNANPPDYGSAVLCVYTFSAAPCTVTDGLRDRMAALPLRRRAAYGTVYP